MLELLRNKELKQYGEDRELKDKLRIAPCKNELHFTWLLQILQLFRSIQPVPLLV